MTVAAEWESFYVIIGSSAAALTGLQFVVVALSADPGGLSQGLSAGADPAAPQAPSARRPRRTQPPFFRAFFAAAALFPTADL